MFKSTISTNLAKTDNTFLFNPSTFSVCLLSDHSLPSVYVNQQRITVSQRTSIHRQIYQMQQNPTKIKCCFVPKNKKRCVCDSWEGLSFEVLHTVLTNKSLSAELTAQSGRLIDSCKATCVSVMDEATADWVAADGQPERTGNRFPCGQTRKWGSCGKHSVCHSL